MAKSGEWDFCAAVAAKPPEVEEERNQIRSSNAAERNFGIAWQPEQVFEKSGLIDPVPDGSAINPFDADGSIFKNGHARFNEI